MKKKTCFWLAECKFVTLMQITNSAPLLSKLSSVLTSNDVFLSTVLTSTIMIPVAIWCNAHLRILQITNCTCPTSLCNFVVFEKDLCLLTPNFIRNHVITYTNFIPSFSYAAKTDCLICRLLTGFGLLLSLLCLLLSWKTKSQYLLYQRHFVLCPIHSKSILQKNFPLVYFVWTLSDLTL